MEKDEKIIYKDGEYIGEIVDALYGKVQVSAIVNKGKIEDIKVLEYPHGASRSEEVNSEALPKLKQEVIMTQGSDIDIISGATETSNGFIKSLESALNKAK